MEIFILILLSTAGFLVSAYFTGVYYGRLRSNVWWIPSMCRMDRSTCSTILKTPEARIFGIPNFVLGMVFYLLMIIMGTYRSFSSFDFLFDLSLSISLFTVVLSVSLIYSLLFKLKTNCILCYTAHAINFCIAVVLLTIRSGH